MSRTSSGSNLGVFLAYRLRKFGKDLTDKVQIYVACILLCALFSPLMGSLSNRLLSFHPTTPQAFEFFKEEGYVSSRFGILEGEDVVKKVEAQGTNAGTPKSKVTIVDSGEL